MRQITLSRKTVTQDAGSTGYILDVTAAIAVDMSAKVFIMQRVRKADGSTSDNFYGVCSPGDLEDIDETTPADGTSFFRTDHIQLVNASPELLEWTYDNILTELQELCTELDALSVLDISDAVVINQTGVRPAPKLTSITITPAQPTVSIGGVVTMIATGHYDDSSTKDITAEVLWDSSNELVAKFEVGTNNLYAYLTGTVMITAELDTVVGMNQVTVPAVLESVSISPSAFSVTKTLGYQLLATAHYTDDTTMDVTSLASWDSHDTAVAMFQSSPGYILGVDLGQTALSATYGGFMGTADITVNPVVLTSITISPDAPLVAPWIETLLTATAHYSDNTTADVSNQVVWASSNPSVATFDNPTPSPIIVECRSTGQNYAWYSDANFADSSGNVNAPGCTPGIGSRYSGSTSFFGPTRYAQFSYTPPVSGTYQIDLAWPSSPGEIGTAVNLYLGQPTGNVAADIWGNTGGPTQVVRTGTMDMFNKNAGVWNTFGTVELTGRAAYKVGLYAGYKAPYAGGATPADASSNRVLSGAVKFTRIDKPNGWLSNLALGTTTVSAQLGAVTGTTTVTIS